MLPHDSYPKGEGEPYKMFNMSIRSGRVRDVSISRWVGAGADRRLDCRRRGDDGWKAGDAFILSPTPRAGFNRLSQGKEICHTPSRRSLRGGCDCRAG